MGDGIRTFTNTGEEDDEELDSIQMDLELYRAFANGFLDSTRDILSPVEIDTLVYAGLLFPYIMGVRFLTDYIAGDVYYKIKHKEHNLVRARAQLRLAQDGEAKLEVCKEIIKSLS
jgi:3-hydroxyacyl-CoA dehydrogenase